MNNSTQIQLNLTIEETNLVLEALGQMTFSRVFTLVSKIQQQATAQINQTDGASSPEKPQSENKPK